MIALLTRTYTKAPVSLKVIVCFMLSSTVSGYPLVPTNKLSLATWGSYHQRDHKGPGTYAFGYDIEDPVTGNIQFKQEERHPNGTITGNYGYVDANGKPHVVSYIADENGYRAKVEVEGESIQYYPDTGGSFTGNSLRETPEQRNPFTHLGDIYAVLPSEQRQVQPILGQMVLPYYFNYEID